MMTLARITPRRKPPQPPVNPSNMGYVIPPPKPSYSQKFPVRGQAYPALHPSMTWEEGLQILEGNISRIALVLQQLSDRMEKIEETIGLALENPLEDDDDGLV